jgi:hypothetical protein
MEYTFPVDPEHTAAVPDIDPGVAGVELIVTAFVAADDVPHVFVAVTVTFPEVAPIVIVAELVP